jgi:hypothetical protein
MPKPAPVHRPYTLAARALAASCGVFLFAPALSPAFAQDARPDRVSVDALSADTIDQRTLDNLLAWARLHGYLTHYNPSEWAWTTNMHAYLRDGFDRVVGARTPDELATALASLATPVAPAALIWPSDEERPALPDLRADARAEVGAVIAWRHDGFTPTMNQNGPLFSRRIIYNLVANEALKYGFAPDNAYERDLPGGVRVRIPHANYVDKFGNILPNPTPRERVRKDWPNQWEYTNASERLAAVAYAWGVIQHFHPMIDREEIAWSDALRDATLEALSARDRDSTTRVVQRLYAKIGDAQAEAWDPRTPIPGLPPITAAVVDGAFFVTGVDANAKDVGVARGDQILSIDGVAAKDALDEWRSRTGAGTNEARDVRAAIAALAGFPGSPIELEIRKPGGAARKVTLARMRPVFMAIDDGNEPIRELAPGIVYVDGSRASDVDVFENAELVLQAPGVIFDMRSPFTDLGMTTLGWLASREGRASEQFIHAPTHPDYEEVNIRQRDTRIMPNPAKALGRLVFLVGPGTRGDAEFATLTMQDFNLGFVAGSHTSGAPGIPARAVLPGGLEVQWTGLESRSVSGVDIFGRGVPPDVETPLTREAIIAGTDPAIDAAIRMLEEYFDTLAAPQTPASPNAPNSP